MSAWIFSTEPDVFPWSRVEAEGSVLWDGIRGPLARKYLRLVQRGDRVWGYYSSPEKTLVCLARTRGPAHPDPKDPTWLAVEVEFDRWLRAPIPLSDLRRQAGLVEMPFLRIPRLSIAPLSARQEKVLERMAALGRSR